MDETDGKYIKHIVIAVIVTLLIGVYLIATTVVISKDGVVYIERAQKLSTQLHKIMNLNEPFGFPVLIAGFHRLLRFDDTPTSWILSAQICVLTCRLIAIVILYLFGAALFSHKPSFWAVLILTVLPWPAEYGADVLREWPHLLFLFTGLLFLYKGVRKTNGFYLFVSGIICALGYIIRPECAQVIMYGAVFFVIKLYSGFRKNQPLRQNWPYLCLFIGFLVIFLPYTLQLDKKIPHKLQDLFQNSSRMMPSAVPPTQPSPQAIETAVSFETKGPFHAAANLLSGVTENLMYYFALPAAIGFWLLFFKAPRPFDDTRLLIGLFIGFYITALFLLDMRWGYISRRHTLPLAVMFGFYIPRGMQQLACWFNRKKTANAINLRKWTLVLTAIGILICLPKLLKPLGYDKKLYRDAASWISENTRSGDRFYTFDKRIPFYADRSCRSYKNPNQFETNFKADYLIARSKNKQIEILLPDDVTLQQAFGPDSNNTELLIFKRSR